MSDLKLASLFSEHMVLQRDQPITVWGWAGPGEAVTVRFEPGGGSGNRGQTKSGRADQAGRWTATLEPLAASGQPARLIVTSAAENEQVQIGDVLVGEVWLCSGQSNMQWIVRDSVNGAEEIAGAAYPGIREFAVPRAVADAPLKDVDGAWQVCSPQTVANFSAVAYFFGRELHRRLGVPVGLLNSSWGGTRVEPWTSRAALMTDELCHREVQAYERKLASLDSETVRKSRQQYQADPNGWLRCHVVADPGNQGVGRGWADPSFDDSAWPAMDLPATWQQRGVPGNGVVWFRRTVDAPAGWAGRDAVLRLGAADKHDVTYVNGEQVGATGWETDTPWCVSRVYRVPGRLIRPGRNVVSSRVYSFRNAGGLVGPSDDMRLDLADGPAGGAISLAGAWRYAIEHDFGVIRATDQPELMPDQNSPYALFDSMIAPLAPYALRGFLWYQGESNAAEADLYRTRFPLLIRDWRRAWGQAQLPFLFVQLANYVSVPAADGSSNWARLRHAQALALREPATGMAVAIDIGDPQDIHPRNKQEVGRRLELAAEAVAYGRPVVASGPVYQSTKIAAGAAGAAHVRFTHVGSGLVARTLFSPTGLPLAALDNPAGQGAGRGGQPGQAEKVLGFAIAGEDRRFVPADARIEGDTVIVSSSQVPRPAAVRYGWADAPVCNLYNGDLLPACPFRTDEW